jgi:hypothetical protein
MPQLTLWLLLLLLLQNPCPAGASVDASGACVYGSAFTHAFNGSTLIACINGSSIASCPDSAPVEVRTLANTPVVVQCITQSTPCPTGFTLALYNGVPSTRQECRPNNGGCNYNGVALQVRRHQQSCSSDSSQLFICPSQEVVGSRQRCSVVAGVSSG